MMDNSLQKIKELIVDNVSTISGKLYGEDIPRGKKLNIFNIVSYLEDIDTMLNNIESIYTDLSTKKKCKICIDSEYFIIVKY